MRIERICFKQGSGSALLGIQVKLANGIVSPFFSGKKLKEGFTKTNDLSDKTIDRVAFRVQRNQDGSQFYTGLKLGAQKKVVAHMKFKDMGDWVGMDVPQNQKLVGFYGCIIDNTLINRIGFITVYGK